MTRRQPFRWTPERDAAMLRMIAAGQTNARIAEALGLAPRAVENRLTRIRAAGGNIVPRQPGARGIWTPERDARLCDLSAQGLTHAQIAAALDFPATVASVEDRLARMRSEKAGWRPDQDRILIDAYNARRPLRDVAAELSVTIRAVQGRLARLRADGRVVPRLGPTKAQGWTEAEMDRLRALRLSGQSVPKIAEALGRSLAATRCRMSVMGLGTGELRDRRRPWDQSAVDDLLARRKAGQECDQIARDIGRTEAAVAAQLVKMGQFSGRLASPALRAPDADKKGPAPEKLARSMAGYQPPAAGPAGVPTAAPLASARPAPVPDAAPAFVVTWVQSGMTAAQKAALIRDHLAQFDLCPRDLELCEAVFGGAAGGLSGAEVSRFRALTAPFRGLHTVGLPIETAGFVLPALRALLAGQGGKAVAA